MGRWPCQPHPPPPGRPPHPRGAPPSPALRNTNNLVRRPEGHSPPGTSRTQGQAGQGQGGQTRGLSGERRCRPCSHPFLTGPHVLLQMKGGGAPPVPGPQGPPYPPAPHPAGPPSHPNQVAWGCPGFWREDQPTAPLQAQPGSCCGLRGCPGPPRSCGTKAGRGACCHAGAARSHGPPPRPRQTTPCTISIGGSGWGLATLTQPTFGFQERKKDRVCYFPATHSSFLCDVCTVRHTR